MPRLVPGYMKAQNPNDRAIAERVQARACTAEGACVAASLWRSFGAHGYDLRADGPSLAAPTLLVWGAWDTILPLKAGRQTHAAIPSAQFRIRALLLEARAEPLIGSAIAQRNRQAVRLITPDFAAIGWADPADGAALWNALVVEAALLELTDGGRRHATRNALAQFLPP